ncbi:MAG: glycosyltransferase [Lachnospiraceae bacterium]|nr:glycosyltransferase [Lachnospiraceae bacterium]
MKYAPIFIPTLDRYEKLKNCLGSLSRNTGAENTEVFISLDYPPAEKYVEGHAKIKEYLATIDELGFKKCHVFYQDKNLGPILNRDFLYDKVRQSFDTYIFTEDDNEFSPCFLDYVNKGLERFKDDPDVLYIFGYRSDVKDDRINNVEEAYYHAPWGFGAWIYKEKEFEKQITRENFRRLVKNGEVCQRLYKYAPFDYRCLFEAAMTKKKDVNGPYSGYLRKDGDLAFIDHTVSPAMFANELYGIAPMRSLVRNMGVEDGSGAHTYTWTDFDHSKQQISEEETFEFKITEPLRGYKKIYEGDVAGEYPAAKRARFLRQIYLIFGLTVTRSIMKLSYDISKRLAERRS